MDDLIGITTAQVSHKFGRKGNLSVLVDKRSTTNKSPEKRKTIGVSKFIWSPEWRCAVANPTNEISFNLQPNIHSLRWPTTQGPPKLVNFPTLPLAVSIYFTFVGLGEVLLPCAHAASAMGGSWAGAQALGYWFSSQGLLNALNWHLTAQVKLSQTSKYDAT